MNRTIALIHTIALHLIHTMTYDSSNSSFCPRIQEELALGEQECKEQFEASQLPFKQKHHDNRKEENQQKCINRKAKKVWNAVMETLSNNNNKGDDVQKMAAGAMIEAFSAKKETNKRTMEGLMKAKEIGQAAAAKKVAATKPRLQLPTPRWQLPKPR